MSKRTPTKPVKPTRWFTIRQAAEHAGVSEKTIDRWIPLGLRVSRIGRIVRISEADFDAFMRSFCS